MNELLSPHPPFPESSEDHGFCDVSGGIEVNIRGEIWREFLRKFVCFLYMPSELCLVNWNSNTFLGKIIVQIDLIQNSKIIWY